MMSYSARYQALLAVRDLVTTIARGIRWRLASMSDAALFWVGCELMDWAVAAAKDEYGRSVTPAAVRRRLESHPLQKYLTEETLRREYLREKMDPWYLGDLTGKTDAQLRDYLIRRSERQQHSPKSPTKPTKPNAVRR